MNIKEIIVSIKKNKILTEVLDWVIWIGGAIILAYIISNYIIINSNVPTGSMISTIMPDDRLIGFRLQYVFTEPKRGEIIVFKNPDDESKNYVKRLIGLPGETVEIIDGVIYIDDVILQESYLGSIDDRSFGPYEVPEDSYFFLGDNRVSSLDARLWTNKFVKRDKILAKVLFRYYPSFKWMENPFTADQPAAQ